MRCAGHRRFGQRRLLLVRQQFVAIRHYLAATEGWLRLLRVRLVLRDNPLQFLPESFLAARPQRRRQAARFAAASGWVNFGDGPVDSVCGFTGFLAAIFFL